MAQHYLNAADSDALSRFSQIHGGLVALSIVTDGTETAIYGGSSFADARFYKFTDVVNPVADVEVVMRCRGGADTPDFGPAAHWSASTVDGYTLKEPSRRYKETQQYVAGSPSRIQQIDKGVDYPQPISVYEWARLSVVGGQVKFKWWYGSPADEPATWDSVATNTTHSSGIVGFFRNYKETYITDFGVGTNGDPAPTGPISTGITGTATHQAQAATQSATGERSITGQASHTAATATHSASGTVAGAITGTGSHQATAATHTATGSREVTGTAAHAAQPATQSATGQRVVSGTASHSAQRATQTATAEREITGTATHSAETATQSATGAIGGAIAGSGDHQAQRATHSATGLRLVSGTGSHQAATATHSGTGQLVETVVSGTGSHQAQPVSHNATGIRGITGDSSAQAQTATHNAVAVRKIIASGTHSANDATHEATGSIQKTITGTGNHQADRATHEASSRPILLTPIKNTKAVVSQVAYRAAVSQTVYKVKLTQIDYRVVAN